MFCLHRAGDDDLGYRDNNSIAIPAELLNSVKVNFLFMFGLDYAGKRTALHFLNEDFVHQSVSLYIYVYL